MNLREAQREDVTALIQAFCQLNDIIVDDLHMFVSVIKRDWPHLSIQDLKSVIGYWHGGAVDIRKPRKFTLRFFGEIVSAWRSSNVTKTIVDSNRHSKQLQAIKQPLQRVLTDAAKTWDIQYQSWCCMLGAGGVAPWGVVMCIDDKAALKAGLYNLDTFSLNEIKTAQHEYLTGYRRLDGDKQKVRKSINMANVVKASSADLACVGRMGAYYTRMYEAGVNELVMPDSVVNVITKQYNEL